MPTLAATQERIIPKSVLRHRPIGAGTSPAAKPSKQTSGPPPVAQRASRPRASGSTDRIEEVVEWKRITGDVALLARKTQGARHTTASASAAVKGAPTTRKIPQSGRTTRVGRTLARQQRAMRAHPLLFLGLGMLAMLALWVPLSGLISWGAVTMDDLHYGRPRTYQIDAVVGHQDSARNPSHFVALNLGGRAQILEFPGGDTGHVKVYAGPMLSGEGANLVPVTLHFVVRRGEHLPSMVVEFGHVEAWYANKQGVFVSQ